MVKNLLTGLWLVNPRLRPGADPQKFPGVDHGQEMGTEFLLSTYFYLLNVGSWQQPREQANDVLVMEPGNPPKITPLALAPSPLWGAITGDVLYVYHNPTWNQANSDPKRQISRLDLTSKKVQIWQLPEGWDASDLAVIDGKVILVRWLGSGGAEDGLYEFDPASGQVKKQLLNVADASGVIEPR